MMGASSGAEATPSKEAMDAELLGCSTEFNPLLEAENFSVYSGPMTHARVVQSHTASNKAADHYRKAEALAPDEASAVCARNCRMLCHVLYCRQHRLPEFSPVAAFGEKGALLRDSIER